jgi:two-component system response regulator FixJ
MHEAVTDLPAVPSPVIAVVDDDAAARVSLVRLLDVSGYAVQAYDSGEAFLEAPGGAEASCVVTDLQMPGLTGLELQQALAARGRPVPMVFISGYGTVATSVQAMRHGAVDFLEKPAAPDALLEAIERAVAKGRTLSARQEQRLDVERRLALLTARERQVFDGVVQGLPNKQIGAQLGIALKTVKVHRGRVMQKMEAQSVADLVRDAELLGGE